MKKFSQFLSNSDQKIFIVLFGLALIVTIVFVFWPKGVVSQRLTAQASFAACLSEKGVILYGNDRCEECQTQKMMFGDDFKQIHYVNCDIQQNECSEKDLQGYPMWMYNGKSLSGVQTFQNLAQFSSCQAP